MLRYRIDADEYGGLDDSVQSLYVEDGDGYTLEVEGAVDKKKVDEFRKTSRSANTELNKLKKQFKNVDPEKYQKLLEMEREAEEGKLINAGDIEGLVESRLKKALTPINEENNNLKGQLASSHEHLNKLLIDNRVTRIAAKMGAHETAIDDICGRARTSFTVQDGKAVAIDGDGDPILDNSGNHITMEDWMGNLKTKVAPHCFRGVKAGNESGSETTKPQTGDLSSHDKIKSGLAKIS